MNTLIVCSVVLSLACLTESVPTNLACTRKIVVGNVIMGGSFQSSTAVSVTLGSTNCGGTLQTGTAYGFSVAGYNSSIATYFVIDLTDDNGNAYPGADFGSASLRYSGKTVNPSAAAIIGNYTAFVAWSGTRLVAGTPQNCSARTSGTTPGADTVTFSASGAVNVRVAWAKAPAPAAVFVSALCRYTISTATTAPAQTPTPSPKPSGGHVVAPTLALTSMFAAAILALSTANHAL